MRTIFVIWSCIRYNCAMDFFRRIAVALAVAAIILIPSPSISAAEIKGHCQIRDHGQLREFDVATDEVQSRFQRSPQKISPLATAEAVRQHAKKLSVTSGEEMEMVLYEKGAPRTEFSRRLLTKEILVQLRPGVDAQNFAKKSGLRFQRRFEGELVLLEATEAGGSLLAAEILRTQPEVISAEPQLAKQMQKKSLPNDAFFLRQWHLLNTGQNGGTNGIDVNITNVWNTYRGTGITIGIIDDGLQLTHPDLAPNVNTNIDFDFNYNDNDPSPSSADKHGSCVAGVAGARGNNGIGVCGAAFESSLVGLRLVSLASTDSQEAAAMSHSNQVIFVKNNSWGPNDGVGVLEGPGPLTVNSLLDGVTTGRGGKGAIYVWAGGNGGNESDNANYDGYANSIYTFAIAALADNGRRADYSEQGACLVVTAPSSSLGRQGITTTDLTGNNGYNSPSKTGEISDVDYTQTFGGTSSASPLAAGVIALILQANPNLGYRDVKEILMRSATKNNATDSDWRTNSNGIHFNHKYGAGLINAGAAIALETNWSNLGSLQQISLSQTNLAIAIPDNNTNGILRTFIVTNENFRVEHVTLTVTAPHKFYGDLAITLTSPRGTPSALAELHNNSVTNYSYNNWKFSTVRNWGEKANGTWTVKIADLAAADTGTLNDLQLNIYGSTPDARLALATTSTNRQITLRAAAPGWSYALQTSEDAITWTNRGVFSLTNNGISTLTETNFPPSQRFYRALLQP